jgi:hypothetical protein
MHIASIGIDLGKTTFHLVALGERNKVLVRKKFSRAQLLAYTANLPASLIGLEACAGAHFMGATLQGQGHQVRLIPAQFVKPYRKSNKNDFIDAEAIAEAVAKQNMRFAQLKTQEQLDWQAMHRVRDRLVQRRTALINEIRGFLLERGITFAAQPIHLRKNLPTVIEDAEQNLSPRLRWRWTGCGKSGSRSRPTSRRSPTRSSASVMRMHAAGNFGRSPASAHWSPPPPWLLSATGLLFVAGATSQLGLGSCHGNTPPGASRSCTASASAATFICVAC